MPRKTRKRDDRPQATRAILPGAAGGMEFTRATIGKHARSAEPQTPRNRYKRERAGARGRDW